MFYAIFNNISVISWRSVLLVEETEVPGENHLVTSVTCRPDYFGNMSVKLICFIVYCLLISDNDNQIFVK